MIMPLCHRRARAALPFTVACLAALGGLTMPRARADDGAAVARAETALQRGDCGEASTQYRTAALALPRVDLAARATAVALACGQYATARADAERWLQLAPADEEAQLARIQAELVGYQLPEARAHFRTLLALPKLKTADVIDELAQRAGTEPMLAMVRGLDAGALHGGDVQLTLAALALDGWDAHLALQYGKAALAAGVHEASVAAIEARAQAILGDAKAATDESRLAAADKGGQLILAQSLLVLGKEDEAQTELLRLRTDPQVGATAARLLAQIAIEAGDYAVAEQRCNALLGDAGSAPLAVYYLGLIAERRGDDDVAKRDYGLLAGTGFETQGRRRVAGILYRQGDRDAAVRVLSAGRDAPPEERIRGELAAADLLSVSGAAEEGVSRIDSALKRAPGNPEIAYQRAVLLERAGRADAAIGTLEALHRERPLDSGVTNALGFTLADHKRALPRAEQLIREALLGQPDNPAVLDSLGWVLYRRSQGAAAAPILERAFRLLHDGDIGAHWGEVLWTSGKKGAAEKAWQRALAADPESTLLLATVHRYAPTLSAPKPLPALEPAPRTSI